MNEFRPGDEIRYSGQKFRDEFRGPKGELSPCPRGTVVAKVRDSDRTYVVQFRDRPFIMSTVNFRSV